MEYGLTQDLPFQMLQIPEEAFEQAMAGLIGMDLGVSVEGVATAALHLLREDRRHREDEALELLEEQAFLCDADDDEVADIGPGVPQDAPENPAAPPASAIPAPCPRRDVGVQAGLEEAPADPPAGAIPEPVPRREIGVQAGPVPIPVDPNWDELERGLMETRAMDLAARQRRTEAFEAFDRYFETRAVPHPSAAYWQRLIAAKREEDAHVSTWKAERRAWLQRQQEENEERTRRHLEREWEEARDRRREEER